MSEKILEPFATKYEEILENPDPITVTNKQAENLPEGWVWVNYDDGSGHLVSPNGESYFSYDWCTGEYKITEGKDYDFFFNENYSSGGYSIGSFKEFKVFAEKYVKDNILNKE